MAKRRPKHEMLFFVYVLGSQRKNDRRTYVGWTTDLKRRLRQHNSGVGAKSTRGRKWILLYSEHCKTRNEAMSRDPQAITLLPSQRLAACIIAMNVKPHKNGEAAHCVPFPQLRKTEF
jgi:putative endonuclease